MLSSFQIEIEINGRVRLNEISEPRGREYATSSLRGTPPVAEEILDAPELHYTTMAHYNLNIK